MQKCEDSGPVGPNLEMAKVRSRYTCNKWDPIENLRSFTQQEIEKVDTV